MIQQIAPKSVKYVVFTFNACNKYDEVCSGIISESRLMSSLFFEVRAYNWHKQESAWINHRNKDLEKVAWMNTWKLDLEKEAGLWCWWRFLFDCLPLTKIFWENVLFSNRNRKPCVLPVFHWHKCKIKEGKAERVKALSERWSLL